MFDCHEQWNKMNSSAFLSCVDFAWAREIKKNQSGVALLSPHHPQPHTQSGAIS
jgi:hypothetical protein